MIKFQGVQDSSGHGVDINVIILIMVHNTIMSNIITRYSNEYISVYKITYRKRSNLHATCIA